MKAIALLYLLTAGISPAQLVDDSGWSHENPVRTGESPGGVGLSGVAVLDSEAVVAVGSYGTILRTTDGGGHLDEAVQWCEPVSARRLLHRRQRRNRSVIGRHDPADHHGRRTAGTGARMRDSL